MDRRSKNVQCFTASFQKANWKLSSLTTCRGFYFSACPSIICPLHYYLSALLLPPFQLPRSFSSAYHALLGKCSMWHCRHRSPWLPMFGYRLWQTHVTSDPNLDRSETDFLTDIPLSEGAEAAFLCTWLSACEQTQEEGSGSNSSDEKCPYSACLVLKCSFFYIQNLRS